MSNAPKTAFKTTDPAIVADWKRTAEEFRDISDRAVAEAEAIGKNKGLMSQTTLGEKRFVGLAPEDPADPPEGWRYVREQFEPRIGKSGDAARAWLASIQRPSMRELLKQHGLPKLTSFKYGSMGVPGLFLHNDTIWAMYPGEPDGEVGPAWQEVRPSEFYAAQEDAEAAEVAA